MMVSDAVGLFRAVDEPRLNIERLIDFRTLQERNTKLRQTTDRRKSRHRLSVSRRGQLDANRKKVKQWDKYKIHHAVSWHPILGSFEPNLGLFWAKLDFP